MGLKNNISGRFVAALTFFILITNSSLSAAEKVVLQLRWDHQFQFAGYYAALWRGYYRDAGLDVEIRSVFEPNGKFHNVISEVAKGRADFGTGAIDILQARNDGIPLVVVASVFQQSPVAFFAKAGTNLNNPADLTSLRVATRGSGGMAIAELRAMLRAEDIDPALVKLQTIRERLGLFDLAKGNADVVSGFTISAGWVAKEQGLTLHSLRPSTYGVDFYGSALFTHQRLIDDNPEMVQRFKTASMKGWIYALENPDEIVAGIAEKLKRKIPIKDTRGFNAFQAAEVRKLTNYPVVQFGHTNPERWRKMHLALVDLGLAKGKLQSASFLFDLEVLKRRSHERNFKIIVAILGGVLVVLVVGMAWWRYRSVLRLNQALRESEKQFKGMFENAGVGVAKTNPDGRFLLVNDRFVDIVGHDRGVLLSLSFGDITHPEDLDISLEAIKELLAGSRRNYVTEKRYISADGDVIWTTLTVQVVRDDDGTPEYLLAVIEDIGDRKQAQETALESKARLMDIFDLAPEAVITIDSDMNIQLFNKGAERTFGYSADEVQGRSMDLLIPISMRLGHRKYVERFEQSSDPYLLMDARKDITGLRKDGSEFPASASVSKLVTSAGKFYTVMLHDVTDRRNAEEDRRQALVRAEEANQAKSDFLATMSHELRTPLNAIIGFSDMIEGQYFGSLGSNKYKEYAHDIHSSSEHLLSLINDILDLSAIEAGKQPLTKEELVIKDVAFDSSRVITRVAKEKNIEFSIEVPDGLPSLFADRRAVKQILFNLLSNAVKFTPEGGNILLEAMVADDFHILKVGDSGIGVPAEKISSLTDPFVRTESDPLKPQEGTGLGLAIVKSLVDLHGGTLHIESEFGTGTTVMVKIPSKLA